VLQGLAKRVFYTIFVICPFYAVFKPFFFILVDLVIFVAVGNALILKVKI
jgi:hypothetical protein